MGNCVSAKKKLPDYSRENSELSQEKFIDKGDATLTSNLDLEMAESLETVCSLENESSLESEAGLEAVSIKECPSSLEAIILDIQELKIKSAQLRRLHNRPQRESELFNIVWQRCDCIQDQSASLRWMRDFLMEEINRLLDYRPFLSDDSLVTGWVADNNLTRLLVGNSGLPRNIEDRKIVQMFRNFSGICALDIYRKELVSESQYMFQPLIAYARNTVDPTWLTGYQISSFEPGYGCIGRVGSGLTWHQNQGETLDNDDTFLRRWFAEKCGIKRAAACRVEIDGEIYVVAIYGKLSLIQNIKIQDDEIILGDLLE